MKMMYKSAALAAALVLTAGLSAQAAPEYFLNGLVASSVNTNNLTATGTTTLTGNASVDGILTVGKGTSIDDGTVYSQNILTDKVTADTITTTGKGLNYIGGVSMAGGHIDAELGLIDEVQSDKISAGSVTVQGQLDADKAVMNELGVQNVDATKVNSDSLSVADGKFTVADNGDVYAQNGKTQLQVRDDYVGMNYGTNTSIGLNEDGVTINSESYQIDGATGDIATDGTLAVGQGANINGGLAVNGGAMVNGGLTVDGVDVGGSIAQNTADIAANSNRLTTVETQTQANTQAITQESQNRIEADAVLQQGIQSNSSAISSLNSRVSDLGGEIDNVGAISAALSGLHPLDYDGTGSKFQLAAAMGDYDGSQALALGGFYHFNEDLMMSVGGATAFDGDKKTAFNVGLSVRVGQGSSGKKVNADDVMAQLAAMNDKIAALEAENQKLTEKVAALEDGEAAPAEGEAAPEA